MLVSSSTMLQAHPSRRLFLLICWFWRVFSAEFYSSFPMTRRERDRLRSSRTYSEGIPIAPSFSKGVMERENIEPGSIDILPRVVHSLAILLSCKNAMASRLPEKPTEA